MSRPRRVGIAHQDPEVGIAHPTKGIAHQRESCLPQASRVRQRLTDYHNVDEALADLCGDFLPSCGPVSRCVAVEPADLPTPVAELLVHHDHMTTRLEEHHGQRVELRVLREQREGDLYRRTIVLCGTESGEVVEFGVVRIDLAFTPPNVRREILDGRAPLGDILIRHDVLRRIEPRWFLRFPADCSLISTATLLRTAKFSERAAEVGSPPQDSRPPQDNRPPQEFGRVGTIYCNEQPAIELLEVVTRVRAHPCDGKVRGLGNL